jgi:hypothetical protein
MDRNYIDRKIAARKSPLRSSWVQKLSTQDFSPLNVPAVVGISWRVSIGKYEKFDLSIEQRNSISREIDDSLKLIKLDLIKRGFNILNISYMEHGYGKRLKAGKSLYFNDSSVYEMIEALPKINEIGSISYFCSMTLESWPTNNLRSKISKETGTNLEVDYSLLLNQIKKIFINRLSFETFGIEVEWF